MMIMIIMMTKAWMIMTSIMMYNDEGMDDGDDDDDDEGMDDNDKYNDV